MSNSEPHNRAKTVTEHQRRATLWSDDDHDEPNDDHPESSTYYVATNRPIRSEPVSSVHLEERFDAGELGNQIISEASVAIKSGARVVKLEVQHNIGDGLSTFAANQQQDNRSTSVSKVTTAGARLISNEQCHSSLSNRRRRNNNVDKLDIHDNQVDDNIHCIGEDGDNNSGVEEDFNNNHHDNNFDEKDHQNQSNSDNRDDVQLVNDLNASSNIRSDRDNTPSATTFAQSSDNHRQEQGNKQAFSLRPRKRFSAIKDQMHSFQVEGITVRTDRTAFTINSDNNDGSNKSNQHRERKKSSTCSRESNSFDYQDFDNQSSNNNKEHRRGTLVDKFFCSFRKILKQETNPPPERRSNKSHSIYELSVCNQVSETFRRASEGSNKTFEWPNVKNQSNMVTNYGTSKQKVLLPQEYDSHKRARRSSSHRRRSQFRLSEGSNAYTRLTYHDFGDRSKRSILQELKRLLLLLVIVGICAIILWQIYKVLEEDNNYLGISKSKSKLGIFQNYAVSTDARPCAKVGRNLLAKGGHAVDAAIGTLLCMGVVLPNSLGLGGGCLMTIYDNKTKQAIVIDGRETAPSYAFETMFVNNTLAASRGALSVGVPGELAAYWEAHQRYGKLNWTELFEETIGMAEFGSPMVEHLAFALRDWEHARYITKPLGAIFLNKTTGEYYNEGDILVQPQLAASLKKLRDFGVNEFYNGSVGRDFINDLQQQGGKMTMDDLRSYKVLVKPALDIKIDDNLRLFTQPPPGSGVVLSIIMRIMKELGHFKNYTPHESFEAASLFYHHMVESFKIAYAQRAGLEDKPNDERMKQLMEKLLSNEFIKEMASKVTNQTHESSYYGGLQYFQEDHGTAHTSVMDSEGNSVAVTTSVNLYFGSGMVSPTTGIVYNDVMDDFVSPGITNKFQLKPSKFNRIEPGKRPLSSMAPSIFVDSKGRPLLVVGASGGAKITTAVATISLRNTFLDEDIKMAIDAPRIHHQYLPDQIVYENNFPIDYLKSLENRGHKVKKLSGRSSVVMGLACKYNNHTKLITANSDYRKGGSVDGI